MVAAGWTEAQKRAYVLADNQLAITGSGWDPELLRRWLDRLQERTRKFITIEFRAAPTTAPCATS